MLLYSNTKCQVWDGSILSEEFGFNQGLKQGCVLSPFLFSIYLNDLYDALPGGVIVAGTTIKLLMYADDLVLLAESQSDLQYMIDAFSNYCCCWGLIVNLSKTNVMVFRESARLPSGLCWTFNGVPLDVTNNYKYLGVLMNYKLSFRKHLDQKLKTSMNAICSNWLKYVLNPKISISNKLKIFETAANSIMFYAAEVWGFEEFDQTEKIFRFFIKKLLFLPMNTPNYALYLETRTHNQYIKTLTLHFNYIRKVLAMPSYRLPRLLAEQTISKNISWAKKWQDLWCEFYPGEFQSFFGQNLFLEQVILLQAIKDFQWQQHVIAAKNSTFHDAYGTLSYENLCYFNDNFSAHVISLVFKARTGLLNINARAFKKDTIGLCTLCNMDAVENTYHFIAECPIFSRTRFQCFGNRKLSASQFLDVLNCNNILNLYKYLVNALKYRNLLISEFN